MSSEAASLPLKYRSTEITYLSLNDFINLANQLRTLKELSEYLSSRTNLDELDRRIIGDEECLLIAYILNGGSFNNISSRKEAVSLANSQQDTWSKIIKGKSVSDRYCMLLEKVANDLATRDPSVEDLPDEFRKQYDPLESRKAYLKMQSLIGALRYPDRAILGKALYEVIFQKQKRNDTVYTTVQLTSVPDFVFVLCSSHNIDTTILLQRLRSLVDGALAYYDKSNCLLIADRDRKHFEVILGRWIFPFPEDQKRLGDSLYSQIAVSTSPYSFVPDG